MTDTSGLGFLGGTLAVKEMGRTVVSSRGNGHAERWERGFAALTKFRKREGHCCPPQTHVEGKINLGSWVTTQRYYKDKLSTERKRRLDRIGFVWDWQDYLWEQGFATLLQFKR